MELAAANMSTKLTVRERLTVCKWADSLPGDITPTLARGAAWVKSEFGKDVPEAVIRTVLDRADMTDDFQAYVRLPYSTLVVVV